MSNPKNPDTHRMAADYQNHREWLQVIRAQLGERAGYVVNHVAGFRLTHI